MFYVATNRITGQSYPTLGTVVPAFNYLFDNIEKIIARQKPYEHISDDIHAAAKKANEKLLKYYVKTDLSPACAISTGM